VNGDLLPGVAAGNGGGGVGLLIIAPAEDGYDGGAGSEVIVGQFGDDGDDDDVNGLVEEVVGEAVAAVLVVAAFVVVTVRVLTNVSFELYRELPAKWACMLYVPAVLGAFNPDMLYCPPVPVVVVLIDIGEVAVNDIVIPFNPAPVVVSVSIPDTL
jgi:hypothetical protein